MKRTDEKVKRTKVRYYLLFLTLIDELKPSTLKSPDHFSAWKDFVFPSHCVAGTAPNLTHYLFYQTTYTAFPLVAR